MARLTPAETITRKLEESFDPSHFEHLYRLARYAFGEGYDSRYASPIASGNKFPFFPDISLRYLKTGQSRRILTSAAISLSKTLYANPTAEFPGASQIEAIVRQQALEKRAQHQGPGGNWIGVHEACYFDGDQIGHGTAYVSLVTNPRTGLQRVGLQHIPVWQVLTDFHHRDPRTSPWKCYMHVLSEDDAQERFGRKFVQDNAEEVTLYNGSEPVRLVRVFEWWDTGFGKGEATRAIIPKDIDQKPLHIEANPHDGVLPCGEYVNWVMPGMRHPAGRIVFQMATQEALNEIEKRLRSVARNKGMTLVDTDAVDAGSLKRWSNGEDVPVKWNNSSRSEKPPVARIPGEEAQVVLMQIYEMLNREYNAESGSNDFERGNLSPTQRTLGENQLLDQRSQVTASRAKRLMVDYLRDVYEVALHVMGKWDRDPIVIDAEGSQVTLNIPEEPATWLAEFLKAPSDIKISEEALQFQDLRQERLLKGQELDALMGAVAPTQMLNMQRWVEERVKAAGFDPADMVLDPQEAVNAMSTQPQPIA
jgi:hypothetical protein